MVQRGAGEGEVGGERPCQAGDCGVSVPEGCPPPVTDPSVPQLVQCELPGAAGRTLCLLLWLCIPLRGHQNPWRSLQSLISVTLLVAETSLCFRVRRTQRKNYPGATWGTEATISWSCAGSGDLFFSLEQCCSKGSGGPLMLRCCSEAPSSVFCVSGAACSVRGCSRQGNEAALPQPVPKPSPAPPGCLPSRQRQGNRASCPWMQGCFPPLPLQSDACRAELALHQTWVSIKSLPGVAIGWVGCATWLLVRPVLLSKWHSTYFWH